jgi:hypothetical protein
MLNSVITLNEGVKLVFVLREIRSSLEALAAQDAAIAANTPKAPPPPVKINIYSVPTNTRIDAATLQRLDENSDSFPPAGR